MSRAARRQEGDAGETGGKVSMHCPQEAVSRRIRALVMQSGRQTGDNLLLAQHQLKHRLHSETNDDI